jgi:membrane-associated protein
MISASVLQVGGLAAYLIVFAIAASETSALVGLLVPGETLVLAAGALAAQGYFDVTQLIIAVVAGAIVGDSIGYGLGRWYRSRHRAGGQGADRPEQDRPGRGVRPGWLARLVGGDRVVRAEELLARRGGLAIFVGRFIGFVRSLLPFAAGAAGMGYRRFLAYGVPAAIAWGISSVLAGVLLGESAGQLFSVAGMGAIVALAAAAILVLVIIGVRKAVRAHRRTVQPPVEEDEGLTLRLAASSTLPAPTLSTSPAYQSFIVGIWSIGGLSVTPWIAPPSWTSTPSASRRHRVASSRGLCGTRTGD